MVCGQTRGIIDAHSERYDEPFGDHIGEFGLCFACHMAWHGRRRFPREFDAYVSLIRSGRRLAPFRSRNLLALNAVMSNLAAGNNVQIEDGKYLGSVVFNEIFKERQKIS